MTKRADFTMAQLARYAALARETGLSVTIRTPDGTEVTLDPAPMARPTVDPFDQVDMKA